MKYGLILAGGTGIRIQTSGLPKLVLKSKWLMYTTKVRSLGWQAQTDIRKVFKWTIESFGALSGVVLLYTSILH